MRSMSKSVIHILILAILNIILGCTTSDSISGKNKTPKESIATYVKNRMDSRIINKTRHLNYPLETDIEFSLAPGEGVFLHIPDNEAGIKTVFAWFGQDIATKDTENCLHLGYEGEKQYLGAATVEHWKIHHRINNADNAHLFAEWHSTWTWREENNNAVVGFKGRILRSEEDLRQANDASDKISERNAQIKRTKQRLNWKALTWSNKPPDVVIQMVFENPDQPKMQELRRRIEMDPKITNSLDEYDHLFELLRWTHSRWSHNSDNRPSKQDPLTILDEAGAGQKFRCVEYGILVTACAQAYKMPARKLGLKRADVATMKEGGGHVVSEVWVAKFNKWIFLDGQWGVIPERNGVPLNTVEFQRALSENPSEVSLRSADDKLNRENYFDWIYPYLFYFDFHEDCRFYFVPDKRNRPSDLSGRKIMLVPDGAPRPTAMQGTKMKIDLYVSGPEMFYPVMKELQNPK
jgi:hypothetical protein